MFKKIALALTSLLIANTAFAQTTPFSTYVSGLAPVTSISGVERIFTLQLSLPKTITPYQILSVVSGDCTMAAPPSIVCTKTNGANFVASATTDTTNASNISSGSLALTRLALASAFIYVGNGSNNPAAVAVSGDCTMTSAGVFTCLKVNGVSFVASATTDTTNAGNISSGTLSSARYAAVNLAASGNGGVTGRLPFANVAIGSLDTALGYWNATTLSATAIPNCTGALTYSTASHSFACNVGAGSGNIIASGTPSAAQIGVWVDATHLNGTPLSSLPTINAIRIQTFASSGTYFPSAGMQFVIFECVGAGAGGGGISGPGSNLAEGSPGGGSGGYSKDIETAATIGASQVFTIGSAGAGGVAGGGIGGSGGATSIGSFCVANGGTGALSGGTQSGGAGGTAGTGNILAIPGQPGGAGAYYHNAGLLPFGGVGGSSYFGNGGAAVSGNGSSTTGLTGTGFGAGGSGAMSQGTFATAAGGNGTSGKLIATEFTNQ